MFDANTIRQSYRRVKHKLHMALDPACLLKIHRLKKVNSVITTPPHHHWIFLNTRHSFLFHIPAAAVFSQMLVIILSISTIGFWKGMEYKYRINTFTSSTVSLLSFEPCAGCAINDERLIGSNTDWCTLSDTARFKRKIPLNTQCSLLTRSSAWLMCLFDVFTHSSRAFTCFLPTRRKALKWLSAYKSGL